MLSEIYGWFAEGFDSADLKAAKGAARRTEIVAQTCGVLQNAEAITGRDANSVRVVGHPCSQPPKMQHPIQRD